MSSGRGATGTDPLGPSWTVRQPLNEVSHHFLNIVRLCLFLLLGCWQSKTWIGFEAWSFVVIQGLPQLFGESSWALAYYCPVSGSIMKCCGSSCRRNWSSPLGAGDNLCCWSFAWVRITWLIFQDLSGSLWSRTTSTAFIGFFPATGWHGQTSCSEKFGAGSQSTGSGQGQKKSRKVNRLMHKIRWGGSGGVIVLPGICIGYLHIFSRLACICHQRAAIYICVTCQQESRHLWRLAWGSEEVKPG